MQIARIWGWTQEPIYERTRAPVSGSLMDGSFCERGLSVMPTPYAAPEVGERIRRLRLAMGFANQAPFAELIGATRGELAMWESGQRRPSIAKAQPMVSRFGITLDWLFLGDSRHLTHDLAIRLSAPQFSTEPSDQA